MIVNNIIHHLLHRLPNVNKYDFGHLLVVGGSPGMVGAPLLAGEAALRVGAGLVTIASSTHVTNKLEKRVVEIMTLPLPESHSPAQHVEAVLAYMAIRHVNAVVIGPGLTEASAALVSMLLAQLRVPVIVDAGGFFVLRDHLSLLNTVAAGNPGVILTPHVGEYQRLTGMAAPKQTLAIKDAVKQFAMQHHVTLLLKGHRTLVAQPDGSVYENTTGNPGLAMSYLGLSVVLWRKAVRLARRPSQALMCMAWPAI